MSNIAVETTNKFNKSNKIVGNTMQIFKSINTFTAIENPFALWFDISSLILDTLKLIFSIFSKVIFVYEECNGHQSNVQSSKALGSVKWEINTSTTLIQNRLFIAPLLATYECAVLIWLHQYACKAITYTFFAFIPFSERESCNTSRKGYMINTTWSFLTQSQDILFNILCFPLSPCPHVKDIE